METQEKSQEISKSDKASETKNESLENIRERMSDMRKTLLTLEWDRRHNQIHIGMESRYNKLKEEYGALEKQLSELKALEKEETEKEEIEKEETEDIEAKAVEDIKEPEEPKEELA